MVNSNTVIVDFFIHSIPRSLVKHFEWEIEQQLNLKSPIKWSDQALENLSLKTDFRVTSDHDKVMFFISKISTWGRLRFEIYCKDLNNTNKFRFAITPSLGIYRADISELGETLLTESQINSAISRSAIEQINLIEELSFVLGKPWDVELEVFRSQGTNGTVRYVFRTGT